MFDAEELNSVADAKHEERADVLERHADLEVVNETSAFTGGSTAACRRSVCLPGARDELGSSALRVVRVRK